MQEYSTEALADIQDGCSGGLSRLYRKLFGRDISCRYCCDEHDVAYYEGGGRADRRRADWRLLVCSARSGQAVPGWLKELRREHPGRARLLAWLPPLRRAWRGLRAWLIWLAVRLCGWLWWGRPCLAERVKRRWS